MQCLSYIGMKYYQGVYLAQGELRRPCGQFGVRDSPMWTTAPWACDAAEAVIGQDAYEGCRVQGLQTGVGTHSGTSLLSGVASLPSVVCWGNGHCGIGLSCCI